MHERRATKSAAYPPPRLLVPTSLAVAFLILVEEISVSIGGWCVSTPTRTFSVSFLTPNPAPGSRPVSYKGQGPRDERGINSFHFGAHTAFYRMPNTAHDAIVHKNGVHIVRRQKGSVYDSM